MPIQILSPQLANQIAAGEVVERPASVVKELVENSLDAGATTIQIDIEKGGSKLIRVRDNGCGIAKEELELALCRHATSKIADLTDLEQIMSLGFRGEALASISSVSRLTLTSRPADQASAWQAIAEGREMTVQIKPAAHPVGSCIEVVDLFFNTPARRRFLRSDKTEFQHIDELIKRLALSRYDVNWTLTHNGQVIRQCKAVLDRAGQEKRVAQLCGRIFAQTAYFVESQYDDMRLWGWIQSPQACQAQPACQYSYVNGRMMRDKLLNHAIRQAYGERLAVGLQPAFVLYLSVDPQQVDVNVHPAKHEVRFHQARLVHDFVASVLAQVCQQSLVDTAQATESFVHENGVPENGVHEPEPRSVVVDSEHSAVEGNRAATPSIATSERQQIPSSFQSARRAPVALHQPTVPGLGSGWPVPARAQTVDSHIAGMQHTEHQLSGAEPVSAPHPSYPTDVVASRTPWLLQANQYAIATKDEQLCVIALAATFAKVWQQQSPAAVPLLMPIRIRLTAVESSQLLQQASALADLGFDFLINNQTLIVRAVPVLLKQTSLSQWLPSWWQLWPLELPANQFAFLLQNLLKIGLKQHWFSAEIFLNYYAESLSDATVWQAVPLDLSSCVAEFEHLASLES